jgi:hypothetical protein
MAEKYSTSEIVYDLFISYSTDPDYKTSRKVESFLESFHKLKTPQGISLKKLSVCRDGSDFSLTSLKNKLLSDPEGNEHIKSILSNYLQQSKYLLVLCSANATFSPYVSFEIDWFIKNKGPEYILLSPTEGNNIKDEGISIFPEIILQNNIHKRPFYDLRGLSRQSKSWQKVRDYQEELTNLAAHLNNQTSGTIQPLWRREELIKLKRQRYMWTFTAAILFVLAIAAWIQREYAVENERIANENLKKFKIEQFQRNMRNGIIYHNAREDSFARNEFLAADSIIAQYPNDPFLATQKASLDVLLGKNNK